MRVPIVVNFVVVGLMAAMAHAESPKKFTGEKTDWHGFDRFDFLMDANDLSVTPIKASSDEGTGAYHLVDGKLRCIVVVPKAAAKANPWSWRGRYFDHESQTEIELLKRGYHIGFIQSDDMKYWQAWFEFVTKKHGLSQKPAFVGMSGGGRNAFNWATMDVDVGFQPVSSRNSFRQRVASPCCSSLPAADKLTEKNAEGCSFNADRFSETNLTSCGGCRPPCSGPPAITPSYLQAVVPAASARDRTVPPHSRRAEVRT